ncbi:hypothetical protein NX722_13880 [Endozoicomonas gorgoniicola]|uniref:Uncharacterized protein n=1 Tax=Endozoicomonas gorgoniicola TaxID=1234144 RepID=A0ABT3MWF0_9GAMM|nr:hypothetical protein [Endozoicomonas gorgoniicola]MCW7552817.1 hypothetical protein [Endozoicomonas gorgoniicola]MCW7553698.1 hypothetical protein [Endozoicomonas gorgoniicola]
MISASVAQEPQHQKTPETGITLVSTGWLRVELATGFDATALKQVLNILEVTDRGSEQYPNLFAHWGIEMVEGLPDGSSVS